MTASRRVPFAFACAACFALGALVHSSFAQGKKPAFDTGLYQSKDPGAAAAALLDRALVLAENGSWERLAVGRAWYLGGDKLKGQQIFDSVTAGNKAEASDWFRLGRIYAEAEEWDKAQPAFDHALEMNKGDDSGMLEYGAFANVFKDREKAEALFAKAFARNPREFWHFVGAGGSYLGVRPQQ
jgi:tetratricopeptide (TPR) repeat protein